MSRMNAKYSAKSRGEARSRGATIHVGSGGAAAGQGYKHGSWLTVTEAEELLEALTRAIRQAKAAQITGIPPQPPTANAAALPAA